MFVLVFVEKKKGEKRIMSNIQLMKDKEDAVIVFETETYARLLDRDPKANSEPSLGRTYERIPKRRTTLGRIP